MRNICLETITVIIILISVDSASLPDNKNDVFTVNITMTNFETTQEDQHVYIQYKLPDEELMIVGFLSLIDMNVAHHMLTYACANAASDKPFWINGSLCGGEQMLINGWDRKTPVSLLLSKDVGFSVGRNTPYKYIVVDIHYLSIGMSYNSGIQLLMSRTSRKYQAGVIVGGTNQINLQPKTQNIRTVFSCHYNGPPITLFASGVHTHRWGRENSMYRVRDGNISQIAKDSPQLHRRFSLLSSPVEIQKGDYLIGQCVFDNNDDRVIVSGNTHNDEMCNVYVMYSYAPVRTSTDGRNIGQPPISSCWDNRANDMINLIPPDNVVPTSKPTDNKVNVNELTSLSTDTVHKLELSTNKDLLMQLFNKRIAFNDQYVHLVLLILAAVSVLILGALIICYNIRARNIHKLDRLNIIRIDVKNSRSSGSAIFSNWMNQQKGFGRLEQVMEEENQLLDSDEESQSSYINVGDTIITIK